uniref:Uncharacterized protein n=1 Tax=Onchocerca volvulus TaxID=6282 RepID=A0A8R1U2V3_ONCVO
MVTGYGGNGDNNDDNVVGYAKCPENFPFVQFQTMIKLFIITIVMPLYCLGYWRVIIAVGEVLLERKPFPLIDSPVTSPYFTLTHP